MNIASAAATIQILKANCFKSSFLSQAGWLAGRTGKKPLFETLFSWKVSNKNKASNHQKQSLKRSSIHAFKLIDFKQTSSFII